MTRGIPCPAVTPEPITPGTLGRKHRATCTLTGAEHADIVAAAAAEGRTLSNWLRHAALAVLSDHPPTVTADD